MEQNYTLDKKKIHSSRMNAYIKKRKLSDPAFHLKTVYQHRRSDARRLGIKFDVELEDIPYTGFCPILGLPLSYHGNRDCSPSLDRIDISQGYVTGNVRWLSHKANRWKNNMTYDDMKKMLDNFYKVV